VPRIGCWFAEPTGAARVLPNSRFADRFPSTVFSRIERWVVVMNGERRRGPITRDNLTTPGRRTRVLGDSLCALAEEDALVTGPSDVISLPKFPPDLHTGTGNFTVPLDRLYRAGMRSSRPDRCHRQPRPAGRFPRYVAGLFGVAAHL